jgi:hypothetical protein
MGSTSGECLIPALSSVHSENGYKDDTRIIRREEIKLKADKVRIIISISYVFEQIKDNNGRLSQ